MRTLERIRAGQAEYWSPRMETMPREELADWQWRRLRHAVEHARRNSPFWRDRLPDGMRSLREYTERVPLLHKADLMAAQRQAPPYGTWPSADPALGVRYHQTSGTSGNPPLRTFDTARDWAWSVDLFCTALHGMGVRPGHRGMVAFGYSLFMGFWAMHYALERMGCLVVPSGGLDSKTRIRFLLEHRIEVLGCTPSYAMRLLETAREMGVDLAEEGNVQIILAGAEPRPESTTRAIATGFGAQVFNAAGTTELGAVNMFQCRSGSCHIIERGVVDEVLDPDTGRPVGYGERGVRVSTGLGRESMQLFRHWTEDLVVRRPWHECDCGRTWDWYDGGILGRTDDMRKIRGVSVTPVMVEDVMRGFGEVSEFQTVLRTVRGLDTIVLRVEPRAGAATDPAGLRERIGAEVKRQIGIRPDVELVAPGGLPRFEIKAARFHDERAK
ncbi:phenylacetate--CoA ligase [Planomonospora sphaerica]|uniref:Phenylacetate--CoA ligase n=1 Tax=Planomonospora sphaerica TaxID=161355 RepID=A0A161LKC0_9ACTN|nr:AMP-binding protein [Planomonospora sphaerica]GAT67145.1 phenylacetate--CoA ligase [Planomonospora sphaerica]